MLDGKFKEGEAYIFDLEGDGLKPTKIHCLSVQDVTSNVVYSTTDYDEMRSFFLKAKYLIGHNITTFDIPVVERILGIEVTAYLIDTLALSWYLYPERPNHKLENWGVDVGIAKPDIQDWFNLSVEEYIYRCEEDVKITYRVFRKMWIYLREIYPDLESLSNLLLYFQFKMNCSRLQEENRWKVDIEWAEKVLSEYEELRKEKVDALRSAMPKVPKFVIRKKPKVYFKKDETYTSHALKWIKTCAEEGVDPSEVEELQVQVGWDEPNPASTQQLKEWLFSLGWHPTEFKHVKDSSGNMKEIPQINLPFGKGVCPDIQRLAEDHPELEALEGLSVLNHRIPQIKTLLEDMDEEGYTYAGISAFTNTLRMRHARLVNMPTPGKPYSDGIRNSLIAEEGYILVGSDLSSLEDKIKQHFIFPLDPDYVATMQTDTFDPHLTIAEMAGLLTAAQVAEYLMDKDHSPHKKVRSIAKNGNYALI